MNQKNRMGRGLLAVLLVFMTAMSAVYAGDTSEASLVFVRNDTTSFWRTATNSTVTVPIDCPVGASSATLVVNGANYSRTYGDLTDGLFDLSFPCAISPDTENVFDLTLTFDNGIVRMAKLGLIQGVTDAAEGTTRCIVVSDGRRWRQVCQRAVLPIPYGTKSFSVSLNGGPSMVTDTGLGGAQGWYVLDPVVCGDEISLSLETGAESYLASLFGASSGFMLIFR